MGKALRKLLSLATQSLGTSFASGVIVETPVPDDSTLKELYSTLRQRDGFYAFESALHFYSMVYLNAWNKSEGWRSLYDLPDELTFFAEDIFGEQFCLYNSKIYRFNPETGELDEFSRTLEEWASNILQDYEVETGYLIAHEWQERRGGLQLGQRLVPVKPFVLGGKYEIENLQPMYSADGIAYRANIARQIRGLPDGTRVKLTVN